MTKQIEVTEGLPCLHKVFSAISKAGR